MAYGDMSTLSVTSVELLTEMSDYGSSPKDLIGSRKEDRKRKKRFSEYFDKELDDQDFSYSVTGYGRDARKQNIVYKQKEYR